MKVKANKTFQRFWLRIITKVVGTSKSPLAHLCHGKCTSDVSAIYLARVRVTSILRLVWMELDRGRRRSGTFQVRCFWNRQPHSWWKRSKAKNWFKKKPKSDLFHNLNVYKYKNIHMVKKYNLLFPPNRRCISLIANGLDLYFIVPPSKHPSNPHIPASQRYWLQHYS